MQTASLLLATLLSFGVASVLRAEQELRPLTIWNDSDEDIVVVVQTPSERDASRRAVDVPSRSVVFNIPLPDVEGDQLAVAYKANAIASGLQIDAPASIVGVSRIFPRPSSIYASYRINSTIPVLQYRAYKPEHSYGGETGVIFEMRDQMAALSAPVYTHSARDVVAEAMRNARRIDYQRLGQ